MKKRTAILGIDIQNDFTIPSGALFVKGADMDVMRIASFLDKHSSSMNYIALTLDSHQPVHIATQCYWIDHEGYPPALFSTITADDVEAGRWKPRYNKDKALDYLRQLEAQGSSHTIWPPHCIMGNHGWAINNIVMKAIYSWSISEGKCYEMFYKGTHQATEHYSIFKAAVEIEGAKETKLNTKLLDKLNLYDRIIIIGQAADYCVASSVADILQFAPQMAPKMVILTDCMSWIDPNNEYAKNVFEDARQKGAKFTTAYEYERLD